MSIGVIFGGKNCEHDISIITGVGTLNVLIGAGYNAVPIYIDGGGVWYSGANMRDISVFRDTQAKARKKWRRVRIEPACNALLTVRGKRLAALDVAVLCTHGVGGEDGCLQGLLQLAVIPYTGSGVLASAAGMDKAVMKRLFEAAGLPVGPYRVIASDAATAADKKALFKIGKELGYPVIVKPANLGSSIGIGIAKDEDGLSRAAAAAAEYDNNLVIEKAFVGFTELNCAVLGRGSDTVASGIEQPVGWTDFLTFDDKYTGGAGKRGGSQTRPPAKIPAALKNRVKSLAKQAFECIGASGVARVDFLLDGGELYVNEINTIPGSLSYYLFEYEGMSHAALLERLIRLAKDEDDDRKRLTYVYKSDVLKGIGGAKHGKCMN